MFDPSDLPWVVSQCPLDPYRVGAKVYRAGGRPHRQSCRLVDIAESQGKEIVNSMRALSEVEVQKVAAAEVIANKQLEYFKLRDKEIASTQHGLV
jgi:hypothetical protein